MRVTDNRVWTIQFFYVLALSLSYFYCLPLLRTGVVLGITASEVRLYDIVFVLGFLVIVVPNFSRVFSDGFTLTSAHRRLLAWLIVGLVGLFVTYFYRESRFVIGIVRYFRFFSFSAVFAFGFLFITNKRQLQILFDSLLFCIILISIIGSLQGIGSLPNLWPDYYSIYWQNEDGYLATATLAPNHTHYSMIMAIGMIMTFARFSIDRRLTFSSLFFLAGTLPMLYSMIASKGRSGWLVFGVYLLFTILFTRSNRVLLISFVVGFGLLASLNLDVKAGNTTVRDILLYRSIGTVRDTDRSVLDALEDEDKNFIQKVDDNRWVIYASSINYLLANPQYLLMGAGFQNASQGIGGIAVAAHNGYLNILAEHGIPGLLIYVAFLYSLFKLGRGQKRMAKSNAGYYLPAHWTGLFIGFLFANVFAEVIYPGRALFTFLGTFFIVTVVFLHPAWNNQVMERSNG